MHHQKIRLVIGFIEYPVSRQYVECASFYNVKIRTAENIKKIMSYYAFWDRISIKLTCKINKITYDYEFTVDS